MQLKKFFVLAASAAIGCLVGCSPADEHVLKGGDVAAVIKNGKLIDNRDGNEYKVTLIAGTYWMAENLRYADSTSMPNLKGNSWCHEDDKKCSKYGRLYSWTAAMDVNKKYSSSYLSRSSYNYEQGICPTGWRIPTETDWLNLIMNVNMYNGEEGEGTSLKSTETWEESDKAPTPTNRFGFDAKASGRRNNDGETFLSTGRIAFFWSSKEKDAGTSYGWQLRNDVELLQEGNFYKDHGLSVRCVVNMGNVKATGALDSSYLEKIPHEYGSLKYEDQTYRTVEINGVTWMADNMNADVKGSHCYNDDKDNCKKYGRLYTQEAAKSVCPDGWTLPSSSVYAQLKSYAQSSSNLRSSTGWTDKASRGLDFWGFDAKPAGGRDNGDYFDLKMSAYFWSSDAADKGNGKVLWINYYELAPSIVAQSTSNEFSVRCIKK